MSVFCSHFSSRTGTRCKQMLSQAKYTFAKQYEPQELCLKPQSGDMRTQLLYTYICKGESHSYKMTKTFEAGSRPGSHIRMNKNHRNRYTSETFLCLEHYCQNYKEDKIAHNKDIHQLIPHFIYLHLMQNTIVLQEAFKCHMCFKYRG